MSGSPRTTTALRARPAPSVVARTPVRRRRWWPSPADLAAMVGLPEQDRPLPPETLPPGPPSALDPDTPTVLAARLSQLLK